MAIQDSFNINNALNSQAYAYKCWYNYNYGGNTMGISAKEMGQITQTWSGELSNWRAVASDDENAYEIEDDDYSRAKKNGEDNAKDKTGYDGNNSGSVAHSAGDLTFGVIGGVTMAAYQGIIKGTVGRGINTITQKAGDGIKKGTSKVTGSKSVENGKSGNGSAYLAATLAIATAAAYLAKKPNKDEKEACDDLQDEMLNADNALYQAQTDMGDAGDEVTELADEAQIINEDANEDIEEKKAEYDAHKASYDELMEKVQAGETLTDDEKELLKELVPLMQELGVGIGETQEDATDMTGDIYDEMGTYQDTYDNAAETVAEVEGLTDFAESFDSSTQSMCYMDAAAQSLNAYSGYSAGAKLMAGGWWNWALGIASMAAGAASTAYTLEQFSYAGDVGTEIGMRKNTQDLNADTNDVYDESVADYEGWMTEVEEYEIAVPEEMEEFDETMEEINEGAEAALAGDSAGSDTSAGGTAFGIVQPTGSGTGSSSASGTSSTTGGTPNNGDKDKELK